VTALVLYPLLTTALYYLGAKAMITSPLWSRYPPWLDSFLSCAACAGTWYGALVAVVVGLPLDLDVGALSSRAWSTPFLVAGASMVWTPLVAALHVHAIGMIEGQIVASGDPDPDGGEGASEADKDVGEG
jgi:hypothetical protein